MNLPSIRGNRLVEKQLHVSCFEGRTLTSRATLQGETHESHAREWSRPRDRQHLSPLKADGCPQLHSHARNGGIEANHLPNERTISGSPPPHLRRSSPKFPVAYPSDAVNEGLVEGKVLMPRYPGIPRSVHSGNVIESGNTGIRHDFDAARLSQSSRSPQIPVSRRYRRRPGRLLS
jgi:hypothetical protein